MTPARYDVFVCYSHQDAALAERISRRIRTYRPPRATGLARRTLKVFRDRERLTAGSDLGRLLADTVGASERLVLVASPAAARSSYVDHEVAAFLEHKSESDIVVVAGSGDLPDNLPPTLRARIREPLYIDVRAGGRRTFRLESLRLIAALLGVDYAELRREDDQRRRRRRALAVAASILLAVATASAYLVATTPAEAWEQLRQPETSVGRDPLMPIERVAVSARDPSVVVWLGDNARYKRDLASVKETWSPSPPVLDDFGEFAVRAQTALAAASNRGGAIRPVATVLLEATRGKDRIGSGELRVYGFLENGRIRFCRTFHFSPTAGHQPTVTLPLTVVEQERSAFDLEPWAAEALRRAGYDTSAITIEGLVTDHTTQASPTRAEFVVSDNLPNIREVLAATAGPEHAVLSTSDAIADQLQEQLESLGGDDLWAELAADPEWTVYRMPAREKPVKFERESSDLRADARAGGVDPDLAAAFDPALLNGDLLTVEQLTRNVETTSVSVATLLGIWDHHEAVAEPAPIHYVRLGRSGPWRRMQLPMETASTRIVDVVAVDPGMRTVLVVSDREGLFRTVDGGATWQSANLGESRLRNGERVRIIVAGPAVFALAAVGSEPGDDPNPLFRLVHYSWVRRWRLGLAKLLIGPAS